MTIQDFLAAKLRETAERKKLSEISKGAGVSTTALSRLIRHNTASIATCEALLVYFNEDAATRFSRYATLQAVEKIVAADDTLDGYEAGFLIEHFKAGHKFITKYFRARAQ